jgi:hypothetical protein
MTATKEDQLTGILLASLFEQETHLTKADKEEFPLVARAIHTILDIWDTNRIKIRSLDIKTVQEGEILIKVNDAARVCFFSPEIKKAYATA